MWAGRWKGCGLVARRKVVVLGKGHVMCKILRARGSVVWGGRQGCLQTEQDQGFTVEQSGDYTPGKEMVGASKTQDQITFLHC